MSKEIQNYIINIAEKAKKVSLEVSSKGTKEKNNVLKRISEELIKNKDIIIKENKKDIEYATSIGKNDAFIDRLVLNDKRIEAMAKGVNDIINLSDPVGSGNFIVKRPNGLKIQKIRVPIGVVAIIYESRPNVTVDVSALTIKSGNTVILRGGKESVNSNVILAKIIRESLEKENFPVDAVQLIDRTEHEVVDELLELDKYIDVVIPRGGENLIRSVVEKSRIPVIKHDKGVCHIFIDESADREKAENITINAKTQRPSVCNAVEKVLIHKNYPYQKELIKKLIEHKVEVRVDKELKKIFPELKSATEEDWWTEYLDLIITAKVVNNIEEAIDHINYYGSHHSDAIITENYYNAQLFLDRVDSAAVYVNASTRFTDGGEFGLGAEVGISTQKLHVRGPMGLEGLTTEKWIILGNGQIRE